VNQLYVVLEKKVDLRFAENCLFDKLIVITSKDNRTDKALPKLYLFRIFLNSTY
jgi:hypothetical protein